MDGQIRRYLLYRRRRRMLIITLKELRSQYKGLDNLKRSDWIETMRLKLKIERQIIEAEAELMFHANLHRKRLHSNLT